MKLEKQIEIVKELVEGVYELGESQCGWEDDLEKGVKLLKYLESKLKK